MPMFYVILVLITAYMTMSLARNVSYRIWFNPETDYLGNEFKQRCKKHYNGGYWWDAGMSLVFNIFPGSGLIGIILATLISKEKLGFLPPSQWRQ